MLEFNFCNLLFSATVNDWIVIDPNGDLILTLNSPHSEGEDQDYVLHFQVSSETLRSESFYFRGRFGPSWAPPVGLHEKYYLSVENLDAVGLHILLLTMHQPFPLRSNDQLNGLPQAVSLETLVSIVRMTDFFGLQPACSFLNDSRFRWFDQFKRRDETWNLPKHYGEEIMMWWCLARDFEIFSLKTAVETVIFRHTGVFEAFDCPIRLSELEDLKTERGWRVFYARQE